MTVLTVGSGADLYIYGQSSKKRTKLTGRVVGVVNSLVSGSGVGPKYTTFVFELIETNKRKTSSKDFVRIIYEAYTEKQQLKDSFFDYSKLYQMRVLRNPSCDDKLSNFSFEQSGDEKEDVLWMAKGAQREWLDINATLPCYTLQFKDYKLKSD